MTRILVVEDNEANRDVLTRTLERESYEVVVARDGEEAIEMAHDTAPDLIVMDLRLPRLDGWEATRRLKASSATASIPIIALTAHAMASDREAALAAGCDDYATKPLDPPSLLVQIEQLLAGRGAGTG